MDILGFFMLWLLGLGGPKRATGYIAPSLPVTPSGAADAAKKAADKAADNPTPAALDDAAKKAKAASDAAAAAAAKAKAAAKAPTPWPAALPAGLPAFPGGWEADNPPPPDVVTRAWQLLPILWQQGAGARKTEFIGGRWITFVAATHAGNKKGVTAFRVKRALQAA
jgi:hypothetical protein